MNITDRCRRACSEKLPPVLAFYIIFQPLLDCLTAFTAKAELPLTPGVVVRSLFMVLGVFYVVFISSFTQKKWVWITLGVFFAYLGIFMLYMFSLGGLALCAANVKEAVKTFYAPFVLLFLFAVYKEYGYLVSMRVIAWTGGIYAGIILLAYLTGTSFVSYGNSGYGYNGWFYAANEVSCILALTAPVTVYHCLRVLPTITKKTWWKGLVIAWTLMAIIFSANFIGTKIIFIFTVLYCLAAFVWFIVRCCKAPSKAVFAQAAVLGLVCVAVIMLYFRSSLQSYIQNVYIQMMDEDSEIRLISIGKDAQAANEKTWLRGLIDNNRFVGWLDQILSRRLLSAAASVQIYIEGGAMAKLFGIGYANAPAYDRSVASMIEMDFLALLIRHGIVGFVIYIVPYAAFMCWSVAQFFKQPLLRLSSLKCATCLFITLAGCSIAVIAGHALVSPAVAIFVLLAGLQLFDSYSRQNRGEEDSEL